MNTSALFLDRDGTLILDKHYLSNPADVQLIDGVGDSLRVAKEKGYRIFLFTNQSGIGRGYFTEKETVACNDRMLEMMELPFDFFDDVCIAPETPDEPSDYRKPSPLFINEMVEKFSLSKEDCWMVGDRLSDLEAGLNAAINSVFVKTGKDLSVQTEDYIETNSIAMCVDFPTFVKENL